MRSEGPPGAKPSGPRVADRGALCRYALRRAWPTHLFGLRLDWWVESDSLNPMPIKYVFCRFYWRMGWDSNPQYVSKVAAMEWLADRQESNGMICSSA